METQPSFTRNELRILWHLKRRGPLIAPNEGPQGSIIVQLASDLDLRKTTLNSCLAHLEKQCYILRTYKHGNRSGINQGYNPVLKLELVDPKMWLDPLPEPPPKVIMANENEAMQHQYPVRNTNHEPSPESVILALLERNEELRQERAEMQAQLDKLHEIILRQEQEVTTAKKQVAAVAAVPRFDHLTNRLQDALGEETWESLKNNR